MVEKADVLIPKGRKINEIILHCSASDSPEHDDIRVIRLWHLKRGWSDVGYHYFIRKNGVLEKGRDEKIVGAHCKGRNRKSIGICLHGLEKDKFTKEQFRTAGKLVGILLDKYNLTKDDVSPHNKYSSKSCPVYNIKEVLKYSK